MLEAALEMIEDRHPPLFLSVHARFWQDTGPRQRRLEALASLLSSYHEVLTAALEPMPLESMFDQDHRGGLFELLARSQATDEGHGPPQIASPALGEVGPAGQLLASRPRRPWCGCGLAAPEGDRRHLTRPGHEGVLP